MAETKPFENIKPFTLDLSKSFRDKHKKLTYKKLKAVIIKKIYGNLDYVFKSSDKPMMSFRLHDKKLEYTVRAPFDKFIKCNNPAQWFKNPTQDLETYTDIADEVKMVKQQGLVS